MMNTRVCDGNLWKQICAFIGSLVGPWLLDAIEDSKRFPRDYDVWDKVKRVQREKERTVYAFEPSKQCVVLVACHISLSLKIERGDLTVWSFCSTFSGYGSTTTVVSAISFTVATIRVSKSVGKVAEQSIFHIQTRNYVASWGEELEGTVSESEDDSERNDATEEETDDDDDEGFYAFKLEDDVDPLIRYVGTNYPHGKRPKKLRDPVEKEKGIGLWSMIKDNIGKDLKRVFLPVYFNKPLSSLQKCFKEMEYSYLLDQAYEWGRRGNSLIRILYVTTFAVSGYALTEGRVCKSFNPLLGETYEAHYPDIGLRFFSEKLESLRSNSHDDNI
ncbi:Oxysterol-binding protein-related protein 1A [Spatholobus suberectus]|nr:Oxysterol-binding protein-related protein 1A [Spatholobus suberectus]